MEQSWSGTPQLPVRLSPSRAKILAALSLATLALAGGGLFLYEGWQRVAFVAAFAAMSFANLAWAAGSLLPDGPRSRGLRTIVSPLAVVMLLALGAALAYQFGCGA
jgi:hypothetical protein